MFKTGNQPSAGNSIILSSVITTASSTFPTMHSDTGHLSEVSLKIKSITFLWLLTWPRCQTGPSSRVIARSELKAPRNMGRRSRRNGRLPWQRVYNHTTRPLFKAFMMCLMHQEVKKKKKPTRKQRCFAPSSFET